MSADKQIFFLYGVFYALYMLVKIGMHVRGEAYYQKNKLANMPQDDTNASLFSLTFYIKWLNLFWVVFGFYTPQWYNFLLLAIFEYLAPFITFMTIDFEKHKKILPYLKTTQVAVICCMIYTVFFK